MRNQELLEGCISLAYMINEFGPYVFVEISPHTKQTDFMIFPRGWYDCYGVVVVPIYQEEDYGKRKYLYRNDEPNNVEELYNYLAKMFREKELEDINNKKEEVK